MEKKSVGINGKISLGVVEMALIAMLSDNITPGYFMELARTDCKGEKKAKLLLTVLNKLTVKSRLGTYLMEHKMEAQSMLRNKNDRCLLMVAMMCSGYTFFYDAVTIMGKYFHVQQQVSKSLILGKLYEIYGSNRIVDVAYDCVIPMLMEAGIIIRPEKGVYEMVKQEKYSDEAKKVYVQSFLLNNPTYTENDDIESNPYFEFVN